MLLINIGLLVLLLAAGVVILLVKGEPKFTTDVLIGVAVILAFVATGLILRGLLLLSEAVA